MPQPLENINSIEQIVFRINFILSLPAMFQTPALN